MKTLLPFALLCLPVPLAAQIGVEATARTPVGVATSVPPSLRSVPVGPISLPLVLVSPLAQPYGTRLSITAVPGVAAGRMSLNSFILVSNFEAGTTASTAGTPTYGQVDLMVSFVGAPGLSGNVHTTFSRSLTPLQAAAVNACSIDVGNDGTFEATAPGQVTVPVRMNAAGRVDVRILLENHGLNANGMLVSIVNLAVDFTPDPTTGCTITPYGIGCGAMQSSGASLQLGTTRSITLLGSGSGGQSMVLSAFGLQNIGPTLPGGCTLSTDAMFVMPLLSDRFGYVSQTLTVPVAAAGTLYHQFVGLDPFLAIAASNGLDITCAR